METETEDRRKALMKERLSMLASRKLGLILDKINEICTDEFNYDEATGKFCPLAVAESMDYFWGSRATDDNVYEALKMLGYNPVNILKGVEGKFYHGNDKERKHDLVLLIKEIVNERKLEIT